MALLDDCKDFLDIYNKLHLNEALTKQLVAESNALLERLATLLDLVDVSEVLEDPAWEMHRWKRIIKTFVVSMLGKCEDPTSATVRAPPVP